MRIIVPPITRPILLSDYAPELVRDNGEPITVYVWVNPPRRVLREFSDLNSEVRAIQEMADSADQEELSTRVARVSGAISEWYAALWSQHRDTLTHWTADEVRELSASDADPALYDWLCARSWEAIRDYRAGQKKT